MSHTQTDTDMDTHITQANKVLSTSNVINEGLIRTFDCGPVPKRREAIPSSWFPLSMERVSILSVLQMQMKGSAPTWPVAAVTSSSCKDSL